MWLLKIVGSHLISLVHYVNTLLTLPSILRHYLLHKDRPALKIINLPKETRNSESVCNITAGLFSAVTRHRAAA